MPTIKDIAPESVFTIELNAGTPGIQGPQGPQGVQGPVGPEGKIGPKPIRGIDYFTQQDINNMVSTVTSSSNSAFNENVANRTAEFNSNVSIKTTAFDNNALLKTEDFNTNAKTKKTDFNLNANNRTTEFNTNAENKKSEFDTNVANQTKTFNDNASDRLVEYNQNDTTKTNAFNNNATNKTNTFNSNANSKTETYNNNHTEKLNAYNTNADTKLQEYNDNATLKEEEYNSNATAKMEEFNQIASDYDQRITANEEYLDTITPKQTAKGELVHITDALNLPTFGTKTSGNVKQETTKGTNEFNAYAIANADIVVSEKGKKITLPISTDNGYMDTKSTLKELCPNLKVGDIVYLYFNRNLTANRNTYIYLKATAYFWYKDTSKTITQEDLDSIVVLYGNRAVDGETEQCILTDFQITKEQNAPWEKFTNGASPNPEYPQEIEVIEGDLSIKVDNGLETTDENYKEQIVPLDLKGNFIGKINDSVKDYLVTDKKKYWLVKKVGKVVLDGSESDWNTFKNYSNHYNYYIYREDIAKTIISCLSNYFKYKEIGDNSIGEFQIGGHNPNKNGNIVFNPFNDTTNELATFKSWLSTHNTEVYYPLAKPQIIELGELPEPIKTFEGVNNIQVLANLDTEIEVLYGLDVKKYYDNKLAEISAQII